MKKTVKKNEALFHAFSSTKLTSTELIETNGGIAIGGLFAIIAGGIAVVKAVGLAAAVTGVVAAGSGVGYGIGIGIGKLIAR